MTSSPSSLPVLVTVTVTLSRGQDAVPTSLAESLRPVWVKVL